MSDSGNGSVCRLPSSRRPNSKASTRLGGSTNGPVQAAAAHTSNNVKAEHSKTSRAGGLTDAKGRGASTTTKPSPASSSRSIQRALIGRGS